MSYIGNSPGVASQRVTTTLTATAAQTQFTTQSGYILGYVDVYLNGAKLVNGADFEAITGTYITLFTGAAANDVVELISYVPRGLTDGYTKAEADAKFLDVGGDTASGTLALAAASLTGNLTLSGGTANGVGYLNGSKVLTSGSALTFDGTTLATPTLNLTNALGVAHGGTGQTTANAGLNALLPAQTGNATKYLQTDGSNATWDAISISTADITGTLPTTNGGTGLTAFTANGVVYASSTSALATGSALTFDGSNLSTTGQILVNNNNYIGFKNTTGTYAAAIFNDTANFLSLFNSGNTGTIFFVNSAEAMRLTSSSLYTASGINVGIGTSLPSQKLHVNVASGSVYEQISSGSNNVYIGYNSATALGVIESNNSLAFNVGSSYTERARISATGTFSTTLDASINGLTVGKGNSAVASNTAFGQEALFSNTTGSFNVAIGRYTMYSNTTGINNAVFGRQAMETNTTGSQNTAVGNLALYSATTADNNTAVGFSALNANTTGTLNIAVGTNALVLNTTGQNNTAVGVGALEKVTTVSNLSAFGRAALSANTTGVDNDAFGSYVLAVNTTGSGNSAFGSGSITGESALRYNTTGSYNTAFGSGALKANTTASYNTAVGFSSLNANTTGTLNTAVGNKALFANTTGLGNTAVGDEALRYNTTASYNTALGRYAAQLNTTGTGITAVGHQALASNTTGTANIAVGG
jgi:hypothetical protein